MYKTRYISQIILLAACENQEPLCLRVSPNSDEPKWKSEEIVGGFPLEFKGTYFLIHPYARELQLNFFISNSHIEFTGNFDFCLFLGLRGNGGKVGPLKLNEIFTIYLITQSFLGKTHYRQNLYHALFWHKNFARSLFFATTHENNFKVF